MYTATVGIPLLSCGTLIWEEYIQCFTNIGHKILNDLFSMQPLQINASKVSTLHLSNITLEDAGEYLCMAEGSHAGQTVQAMQAAWLDVLPGNTLLPSFSSIPYMTLDHNCTTI